MLRPQQDDKSIIEDIRGFNPLRLYSHNELYNLLQELDVEKSSEKPVISLNRLSKVRNIVNHIPGARRLKQNIQQRLFNKNFSECHDHIYWEPNYILENFDGISIPTIYDLSHLRYPQFHPKERKQWLDDNLSATIENSTAIIAISEFSKQEIIDVFGINEEKITIVQPAVSDLFRQNHSPQTIQEIHHHYQLPKQFILSVGTLEPRKNLTGLLSSYKKLPEKIKNTCPLVIVGCNGWLSSEIEQIMNPLLEKGHVIRLGYVSQQHLPILYAAATLFVYISHYEGYGMPIAEAMCSGTPVITSSVTSMPEVAGGCAQLVEPNDSEQVSIDIQELLENKSMRKNLIHSAKIKSADYTWEKSADKLIQLFDRWQR